MTEQLSLREKARFVLVRKAIEDDDALSRAFVAALRLSAETLGVARVGIWQFEDEGARIRCTMVFDSASGSAGPGEVIDLTQTPRYAEALHARRAVVADDARRDPRTTELSPYLERHGITSLLDCPVFERGDAVGVVCHEHIGPGRAWSDHDKHFASTVSDMLGLYLEQRAAQRHYRDLLEARRALERRHVMESLGRMAASIAHDFNNVLLAVGLRTELLGIEKSKGDAAIDAGVAEVAEIVEQGRRLARKLLDMAAQDAAPTSVIDLVPVLRGLRPTLAVLARDGVELAISIADAALEVRIERAAVEQIVMNLAHNARDAMLGGGRLEITLEPDVAGDVVLVVRDTGVGMDDETRERIFEPFFTTKPKGHGDGLGLATVYYAVTAAGGRIDVTSQVSAGTEFRITLPRAGAG